MADEIEVDTLAEVHGTLDVPSSFPRVVYRPYDREPRCSALTAVSEDRRKPDVETESDTAEEDSDDMDDPPSPRPSSTVTSRLGTRGPGAGDLQCLANDEPSAGSSDEPPPRPSW